MYYKSENLGDKLNYYLLNKITNSITFKYFETQVNITKNSSSKDYKYIKKLDEIGKVDLLFIGSILNVICNWRYNFENKNNIYKSLISKWYFKLYDYFFPLKIFGAGFLCEKYQNESYLRNINLIAVRGKITLQRLINNGVKTSKKVILADPGILLPIIYDQIKIKKQKKIYNLCIIPHYIDKNNTLIKKNIRIKGSLIINIEGNPYYFMSSLSKCQRVLSSSLHGLIISDSMGIPNMRMIVSDKIIGGDYKFKDYYSAFDLNLPFKIDLRNENFTENHLKLIDLGRKIPMNKIRKKQCELLINFPYQLNKKLKLYKIMEICFNFQIFIM